jgi:hypothetical protein
MWRSGYYGQASIVFWLETVRGIPGAAVRWVFVLDEKSPGLRRSELSGYAPAHQKLYLTRRVLFSFAGPVSCPLMEEDVRVFNIAR